MTQQVYKATISANGQLQSGDTIDDLKSGDLLKLIINGRKLATSSPNSLLGSSEAKRFLPESYCFELIHLEPQPDGTCHLDYKVL